jgi:hypothetical protein
MFKNPYNETVGAVFVDLVLQKKKPFSTSTRDALLNVGKGRRRVRNNVMLYDWADRNNASERYNILALYSTLGWKWHINIPYVNHL